MKRIAAIVMMLVLMCACTASAQTGSAGLDIEYSEQYKGCVVKGRGTCTDEVIVIPNEYEGSPVVALGVDAFYQDENLKKLVLPDGLKHLLADALYGCKNLEYNTVDGVHFLGSEANPYLLLRKIDNKDLGTIEVHSQTTMIYDRVFAKMEKLEEIILPENLVFLGNSVFENCKSLKEITIPAGISYIGRNMFYGCVSLEKITFQGRVSLHEMSLLGCTALKEITLQPESPLNIPVCQELFVGLTSLTDIHFGGTQSQFADMVFGDKVLVANPVTVHCTDGDIQLNP